MPNCMNSTPSRRVAEIVADWHAHANWFNGLSETTDADQQAAADKNVALFAEIANAPLDGLDDCRQALRFAIDRLSEGQAEVLEAIQTRALARLDELANTA